MAKILLFLHADEPGPLLLRLSEHLNAALAGRDHITAQLMRAPEQDFFYDPAGPYQRPQVVVEVRTAPGLPVTDLTQTLLSMLDGARLEFASCAYVMQPRYFIEAPPQAVYYHHCFVKRPEFTLADFNDYYSKFHSRMGLHTPEIAGYAQNFIDQAASAALSAELGLGYREISGISELFMSAIEPFIESPALGELAEAAAIDEARFVLRDQSLAFCSEVVTRVGDFDHIDEPLFEQHYSA